MSELRNELWRLRQDIDGFLQQEFDTDKFDILTKKMKLFIRKWQ